MSYRPLRFGRYDCASFAALSAYAACSVIIPVVLVQLANSLHFPLAEGGMGAGGLLQLGRSFPMLTSLVLCGFFGARWGKIRVCGFSLLLMTAGLLTAAGCFNYATLFCAIGLAGLGEGILEGLATPIVQDVHPDEPGRYINVTHGFWSIGVVGTTLAAGTLLSFGISWRFPILVCALATFGSALLYLLPYHGPQRVPVSEIQPWRVTLQYAKDALTRKQFWYFFAAMFLAGGGEFCLTFWVASYVQLNCSGSAFAGGVATAVFSLGMIGGRLGSGFAVPQNKLKKLVLTMALTGTVFGLLPPLLTNFYALLPVLFILGVATGPYWPSIQSYTVDKMEGDPTMLYILLSCAGVPGCGVFTTLMGVCGDWLGLRASFLLVPLSYGLLGLLIYLEGKRYRHKSEVCR